MAETPSKLLWTLKDAAVETDSSVFTVRSFIDDFKIPTTWIGNAQCLDASGLADLKEKVSKFKNKRNRKSLACA